MDNLVCRACLRAPTRGHKTFEDDDDGHAPMKLGEMLQFCVPEMDIYASHKPILCMECVMMVCKFYNFKNNCVEIETKIQSFMKKTKVHEDGWLDLKALSNERLDGKPSILLDVLPVGGGGSKPADEPQPVYFSTQLVAKPIKSYHCSNCGFSTPTEAELRSHVCLSQNNKIINCPECRFSTNSKVHLNAHMSSAHKVFKCPACTFVAWDLVSLRRHQRQVHDPPKEEAKEAENGRMYKCSSFRCPYMSSSLAIMQRHREKHDQVVQVFKCKVCKHICNDRSNFRKHILTHAMRPLTCRKCRYESPSPYQMRRHYKKYHINVLCDAIWCRLEGNTKEINLVDRNAELFFLETP